MILLATRNGARFLDAQLASIASQSHPSWCVLVSDDGSTDATREILRAFAEAHPGRVSLLEADPVSSAKHNFFRLLRAHHTSDYIALCDQDDVWHVEKLRELVAACQAQERASQTKIPCLVYSDLAVVDETLNPIAESFMAWIRARPERVTLGSLLAENLAPGCSMLMNRRLLEEFQSWQGSLDDAAMHDWWLALLAEGTGILTYVDRPLVQYRQHARNTLGAVRRSGLRFALRKLFERDPLVSEAPLHQARLFAAAHGDTLRPDQAALVTAYASMGSRHKLARAVTCLRFGILKQTFSRRVYQLITV